MAGKFIISLDFELHWGGIEKWDLSAKKQYFLDARTAVVEMLQLFKKHEIRATWATVGFLFAKDKNQLLAFCPNNKPTYSNKKLSSYHFFNQVGKNEKDDPFHYAGSLIDKIIQTTGQELATHTFSHYYCLEEGQDINQFDADLKAAKNIALANFGVNLESIVFPRNQYNETYLETVLNNGISNVRSNPNTWFWQKNTGKLTPFLRALDTLIPIGRNLSFELNQAEKQLIKEIPASRFFRPYSKQEQAIQRLKMYRIKREMTITARRGKIYHLWWHPHNFGNDLKRNLNQLEEILQHYDYLKKRYNFASISMKELYN